MSLKQTIPDTPAIKQRAVDVDDEVWRRVRIAAAIDDVGISEWVVAAIREKLNRDDSGKVKSHAA